MRWVPAGLLAAVALLAPGDARAHASLEEATPAYRERLERSPGSVVLRFSQVVGALPNGIVVLDEAGRVVSAPAHLGTDGRSLRARLPPLGRGAYTVRWQTLSRSDGHVISGVYTFGVGVNAPPPSAAIGARGPSAVEQVVRWLAYVALAVLAGGLAVRLLAFPRTLPDRLDQAFFALVGGAAVLAMNTGIAGFLLRADAALQLRFERFLYADLSPFAGGTRFGVAWVWMTLATAVVGALLTLAWLRRSRTPLWPALAVTLATAAGFSLSGHSASRSGSSALTVTADWVHIAAASIWIGGVVGLALIGWRLERAERHAAFLRFSRLATGLVGVVIVAGVYLGVVQLVTPSDIWETEYGRVLLVKLVLVALALAWGAAHHALVRPRLERGYEPPGGIVGRSLLGEGFVGVALLLVVAILVTTSPPGA